MNTYFKTVLQKEKNIKYILSLSSIVLLYFMLDIGCLIRGTTTIPCPFCGMSRAMLEVFQLEFYNAYQYHPLFFIFPLYLLLVIDYINYPSKFNEIASVSITILFFIVYLIRIVFYTIP